MREKIINAFKYLFFLALGLGLLWYISKDLNFDEVIVEAMKMNFWFFALSGVMALVSHYSRAIRWRYLIETQGYSPKTLNVFFSVLIMYVSNLVLPRSGEVARCGSLYKYEKIPVPKLLGTVVIERFFDLLVLALGTIMLLFWQFDIVVQLYNTSRLPEIIQGVTSNKWWIFSIGLIVLGVFAALFILRKNLVKLKFVEKIFDLIHQVAEGMKKVLALEKKWLFLFHTVLIWVLYFGMTYACFYAYPPTSALGLSAGFAVFVAGSFGMIAPTNGGIGAWHFMVIATLGIYGIAAKEATLISNIAFVIMTFTVACYGIISLVLIQWYNLKYTAKNKNK